MIDTHTHLYFPEYGDEIDAIMQRSLEGGVSHFILPGVSMGTIDPVKKFHLRYPDITSIAIGLHPTEVKEDWEEFLPIMEKELSTGIYKAVGEIGMDLYWDQSMLQHQKKAFEAQLLMAEKYKLPVIIHSRNATDETMEIVEKVKPSIPLIFHSFTGKKSDVERIRKGCDPFFGINGVVTYKNAPELRDALPMIGLDKMVLETDAPYLTPVPHRGKRNDSSYLCHVKDKIAESLQITPEEVEKITDSNARKIFGLSI